MFFLHDRLYFYFVVFRKIGLKLSALYLVNSISSGRLSQSLLPREVDTIGYCRDTFLYF
jgi:hypothetical protein